MSKNMIRSIGVAASAGALALAVAPAAHANSFTEKELGVTYSYNDGTDQFCVDTRGSGRTAAVTLNPSAYGQAGPRFSYTVGSNNRVCKSLATAYEDTYYFVSLDILNGGGGSYVTKRFYS